MANYFHLGRRELCRLYRQDALLAGIIYIFQILPNFMIILQPLIIILNKLRLLQTAQNICYILNY
ncbi:hypothetical protein H6G33_22465 [Calothrix sp. FACHB-1219]|uniref:hypothetical protein n=1 Tax=unclassified Calothrix TaxID=2619626 RepID=UPI0016833D62|nr:MULTISPECIES: hypothetical protein [unclassified Calothrix]MBD2200939.1 hypothetical protein [Calothrix sp. FACHB-168]MBD2219783.1 hypothetical protein [Calothrix sp. FACHB-1219]